MTDTTSARNESDKAEDETSATNGVDVDNKSDISQSKRKSLSPMKSSTSSDVHDSELSDNATTPARSDVSGSTDPYSESDAQSSAKSDTEVATEKEKDLSASQGKNKKSDLKLDIKTPAKRKRTFSSPTNPFANGVISDDDVVMDTPVVVESSLKLSQRVKREKKMADFVTENAIKDTEDGEVINITPFKKKRKSEHKIDPRWQIAFDEGWTRELVYRATCLADGRRAADAYYRPPGGGKKLRSLVELKTYIAKNGLAISSDCFSFSKFPIGEEPHEVVRDAKAGGFSNSPKVTKPPKVKVPKEPKHLSSVEPNQKSLMRLLTQKENIASDINADIDLVTTGTSLSNSQSNIVRQLTTHVKKVNMASTVAGAMQRIVSKAKKRRIGPASDIPLAVEDLDDSSAPTNNFNGSSGTLSEPKLCGLDCPGQEGTAPDLHCSVCMCLYHRLCVGMPANLRGRYVCCTCSAAQGLSNTTPELKSNRTKVSRLFRSPTGQAAVVNISSEQAGKSTPLTMPPPPQLQPASIPAPPQLKRAPIMLPKPASSMPLIGPRAVKATALSTPPIRQARPLQSTVESSTTVVPVVSQSFVPTPKPPAESSRLLKRMPASDISVDSVDNGQYLNLPSSVIKHLTPGQPLSIKIGARTLVVPSKDIVVNNNEVKVLLPKGSLAGSPSGISMKKTKKRKSVDKTLTNGTTSAPSKAPTPPPPAPEEIHSIESDEDAAFDQITEPQSPINITPDESVKAISPLSPLNIEPNGEGAAEPLNISPKPITGPEQSPHNSSSRETEAPAEKSQETAVPMDTSDRLSPTLEMHNSEQPADASGPIIGVISPIDGSTKSPKALHVSERTLKMREYFCNSFTTLNTSFSAIQKIFQYLQTADLLRIRQVCKAWKTIATECFWSHLCLADLYITDWTKLFYYMIVYNTESLDMLRTIMPVDWNSFIEVYRNYSDGFLYNLALPCVPVTGQIFFDIVTFSPSLKTLVAKCVGSDNESDIDENVLNLSCFCKLPNLQRLELQLEKRISLTELEPEFLEAELPLKSLVLHRPQCDEDVLLQFVEHFKELEHLEISDCSGLMGRHFNSLNKLEKLKSLRLELVDPTKMTKLSSVLGKFPADRLESLELIHVDMLTATTQTIESFTNLKQLTIWHRSQQKATVLSAVFEMFQNCPKLQTIDWGLVSNDDNVKMLCDDKKDAEFISISKLAEMVNKNRPQANVQVFRLDPYKSNGQ